MKHSRRRVKGARVVREIIADLQEQGIGAEAQPLSGQLGGKHSGDISIPVQGEDWLAESKARANGEGFKTLHAWKGTNRLLFLKQNRMPTLVVLTLDDFIKLAKLPSSSEGSLEDRAVARGGIEP